MSIIKSQEFVSRERA